MAQDVNHWGVWVNPEIPTTGVFTNNKAPEGFYDDVFLGIDLECESCEFKATDDSCDGCDTSQHTILAGEWIKDELGKYIPDPGGEYSAIVGEIYTQVVRSKKTKRCALCSPCYPGQGDLESKGNFLAYCLPWGDDDSNK